MPEKKKKYVDKETEPPIRATTPYIKKKAGILLKGIFD